MCFYRPMNEALDTIQENLKALIQLSGSSAAAISVKAGLGKDAVRDIYRSRSSRPKLDTLMRLAEALDCRISDITGEEDAPAAAIEVPLIGEVQAGYWLMAGEALDPNDENTPTLPLPEELYSLPARDKVFALHVVGDSMNAAHILPGAHVFCLSIHHLQADIQPDHIVVAEARRADGCVEATLKQVQLGTDGRFWLYPRSTNPLHQAPVAMPAPEREPDADTPHDQVIITARMLAHRNPIDPALMAR